MGYRIMPVL